MKMKWRCDSNLSNFTWIVFVNRLAHNSHAEDPNESSQMHFILSDESHAQTHTRRWCCLHATAHPAQRQWWDKLSGKYFIALLISIYHDDEDVRRVWMRKRHRCYAVGAQAAYWLLFFSLRTPILGRHTRTHWIIFLLPHFFDFALRLSVCMIRPQLDGNDMPERALTHTQQFSFVFHFFIHRLSLTSEVNASMRQSIALDSRQRPFGRAYSFRSSLAWCSPSASTASWKLSRQIDLKIVVANNWHSRSKSKLDACWARALFSGQPMDAVLGISNKLETSYTHMRVNY